jgi:hypothetical protein
MQTRLPRVVLKIVLYASLLCVAMPVVPVRAAVTAQDPIAAVLMAGDANNPSQGPFGGSITATFHANYIGQGGRLIVGLGPEGTPFNGPYTVHECVDTHFLFGSADISLIIPSVDAPGPTRYVVWAYLRPFDKSDTCDPPFTPGPNDAKDSVTYDVNWVTTPNVALAITSVTVPDGTLHSTSAVIKYAITKPAMVSYSLTDEAGHTMPGATDSTPGLIHQIVQAGLDTGYHYRVTITACDADNPALCVNATRSFQTRAGRIGLSLVGPCPGVTDANQNCPSSLSQGPRWSNNPHNPLSVNTLIGLNPEIDRAPPGTVAPQWAAPPTLPRFRLAISEGWKGGALAPCTLHRERQTDLDFGDWGCSLPFNVNVFSSPYQQSMDVSVHASKRAALDGSNTFIGYTAPMPDLRAATITATQIDGGEHQRFDPDHVMVDLPTHTTGLPLLSVSGQFLADGEDFQNFNQDLNSGQVANATLDALVSELPDFPGKPIGRLWTAFRWWQAYQKETAKYVPTSLTSFQPREKHDWIEVAVYDLAGIDSNSGKPITWPTPDLIKKPDQFASQFFTSRAYLVLLSVSPSYPEATGPCDPANILCQHTLYWDVVPNAVPVWLQRARMRTDRQFYPLDIVSPFTDARKYILSNSPITMTVTDMLGRQVARSDAEVIRDIPGAAYWPYPEADGHAGEVISLPTNDPYTLDIRGTANGTFTVDVEDAFPGLARVVSYQNVPIAAGQRLQVPLYPDHADPIVLPNGKRVWPADRQPPWTRIAAETPSSANGWYTAPVTVTVATSDDVTGVDTTTCRVDREESFIYKRPFRLSRSGRHLVECSSTDRVGNVEPPRFATFSIDRHAPETRMIVRGARSRGIFVAPAEVLLDRASDGMSSLACVKYALDGAEPQCYRKPLVVTANGVHYLTWFGQDNAGNVEPSRAISFTVNLDRPLAAAPVITLDPPAPGASGYYTGTVTATVALPGGGASRCSINGSSEFRVSGSIRLDDKARLLRCAAEDSPAVRALPVYAAVAIDHRAPRASAEAEGTMDDDGRYQSYVIWYLSGHDDDDDEDDAGVDHLEYQLDGGAWQRYELPIVVAAEGRHVLTFRAVDRAGNVGATRARTMRVRVQRR